MANGDSHSWLIGLLIAAVTGLYGFFIKHLVTHVRDDESRRNTRDIETLKRTAQTKDNCTEIVKRMDENHTETCRKLDRILEKVNG